MTTDLEKKDNQIRLDNNAIDIVAQRMAEKAGISVEKAKTELGIGVVLSIMMNRHKIQERKEND